MLSLRRGEYASGPVTAMAAEQSGRETWDRRVSSMAPLSPGPGLNPGSETHSVGRGLRRARQARGTRVALKHECVSCGVAAFLAAIFSVLVLYRALAGFLG